MRNSFHVMLVGGVFAMTTGAARAEECVIGVRILCPWTAPIRPASGLARDWPAAAAAAGFRVDHNLAAGAVLVYPGDYGNGISPLGHVALIGGPSPAIMNGQFTIWICDSSPPIPGWPNGWARRWRIVPVPNMTKCWVIHPN